MGRPPSNGGPAFRFNQTEVTEMETILQEHNTQMPAREVLVALAEKFSNSEERSGKIVVQMKQVWNWFQNRRYAIRAKAAKVPGKLSVSPMPRDDSTVVRNVPQAPQSIAAPSAIQSAGRIVSDNSQMEFEAKSARDGAWYDVANFLSHRSLETLDPDVLVRFAGFGPEEDEWVNVRKHVRQRSLPCESSECVAVLPGDLILCFQEGKEQALYFDAHVLDAQRRRHDVRGCRCRFLVRYVHDQSEEIVPLRKVCRRPETDYRLQQLHAINDSASVNQQKTGADPHTVNTLRVYPPTTEPMQKKQKTEERRDASATVTSTTHGNVPVSAETKVPQLKFTKISIGGNAETLMVPPAIVAVTSGTETKVLQPKFTEASTASIMKTSTPPDNVAVSTVPPANVALTSATKTEVPQPKFTEISTGGNGDISMVPPTSVAVASGTETEVPRPSFTKISAGGNAEMSMVPPVNVAVTGSTETEVPQSKSTEISAGGNAETSMVPPTNVAVTSGTEIEVPQPKFTEITTDGNIDTSTVPTANVIVTTSMAPASNVAVISGIETRVPQLKFPDISTGGNAETSTVPTANVIVTTAVAPPSNVAVTSSTETEVPQPKFTGVSTTGNEETSMAPVANVAVTSDAATSIITSDSGQNISRG